MTCQKPWYSREIVPPKKRIIQGLTLGSCLSLTLGCAALGKSDSFTFVPDFPPDFKYELTANYVPAQGQTCTVPGGKGTQLGFNKVYMEYEETSEIPLYRTVSGCPLALNRVEVEVMGIFGPERSDRSYDDAAIAVRPELLERQMGTFNTDGVGEFFGECQWAFRTVGPKRYLIKLLTCKKMDEQGNVARGRPFTAYTLTQLPGKTVRLKIKLSNEELPGWGDTWVQVAGGWKRCMGKGYEDQRGYCNGNYKDFSTFKLVDERTCTIYPGCTETKDETP
ncbi:hypothetical protein LOY55_30070 [Pseudomonas sp. B21-040]|uniref:hypothetical protein n=1 Tax=unclassified Pseudomonas TaxID=196821 RepID=UPI001CBF08C6|nr:MULTISPECIES: hypothetical protein [unclassified Pseudomonas]UVL43656.1 hypothetical protein LOY55_30070 [Pseudomonas sp. B21-040]